MLQHYRIFSEGDMFVELNFDDNKTVRELIDYLFEEMDYYEPFGMDIVTLFESGCSRTTHGWFIQDTSEKCAKAIMDPGSLTIAYHMPGVFYFAEGGWGHHMPDLGNHPVIPNLVSLKLKFDEFENSVMVNGNIKISKMIQKLKELEYIPEEAEKFILREYDFPLDRPRRKMTALFSKISTERTITEFLDKLPERYVLHGASLDETPYKSAFMEIK